MFKYDKFVKTNDTELIFEFPLYPEVVEEMNKISAEDKYIAFKISVSDGLIYWINSTASGRGKYLIEGIDKITSSNVEMEYKGNTVGLISFSHEELAKLFSELEETEYEWLTVPIPKIEEGVDEKIKKDITKVIRNLKSARKVLQTPEYGQARLDLRKIRDIIGNYSEDAKGYTLKTELGKIVEEKTSEQNKGALNNTLRGAAAITNKYVHEDRNELKETPPWREAKFAYSLMAYLCWYISNILKV